MNPCDQCVYHSHCDYRGEEDRCPIVRKESALGFRLYGDGRDDEAIDRVREVLLEPRDIVAIGQMMLL